MTETEDDWDDVTGEWLVNRTYDVDLESKTRHYIRVDSEFPVLSKRYKRNGRTFYFIQNRSDEENKDDVVAPKLVTDPKVYAYDFKAMYLLICTGFRVPDILKFFIDGANCSNYGSKIASSLIKIASTRIFADPEQSILELPVNSMDSYSKQKGNQGSVGKFGMGFFSILYWLVGHPLRYMKITTYNSDHQVVICTIREIEGELQFQLQYRQSNVTLTGSRMELNCQEDTFDDVNVTKFKYQLEKLSYTNSDLLVVRSDENSVFTRLNLADIQTPTKIYVQYNRQGILVEDFAQGINLLVLLKTLFVPSVSTKTLETSLQRTSNEYYLATKQTLIKSETSNKFVILVRSVAVVYLDFHTESSNKYHIIIELPSTTRIPVSRDDIIFDNETKRIFLQELQLIVSLFVRQKHIYALQSAFKAYQMYTSQVENRQFFMELEKSFTSLPEKIFVSYKYYPLLSMLDDDSSNCMLEAQESDLVKLEEYLRNKVGLYNPDVYFLKKVVVTKLYLSDKVYATNAELPFFLFVSKHYVEQQPNWILTLPQVYLSDNLYLHDSFYARAEVSNVYTDFIEQWFERFQFSESFKVKVFNLINQIILQLTKLFQRFHFTLYSPMSSYTVLHDVKRTSDPNEGLINYILSALLGLMFLSQELGLLYALKFYSCLDKLLHEELPYNYTGSSKANLTFLTKIGNLREMKLLTFEQIAQNKLMVKYITEWAHYVADFSLKSTNTFLVVFWTFFSPLYALHENDWSEVTALKNELIEKRYDLKLYMSVSFLLNYLSFQHGKPEYNHFLQIYRQGVALLFLEEFVKYSTSNPDILFQFIFKNPDSRLVLLPQELTEKLAIALEVKVIEIQKTLLLLPLDPGQVPEFQGSLGVSEFTESKLIDYVLRENVEDESVFSSVAESKSDSGLKVQITEIAINEGSTKSFIHATLTETVQNSLDAIREFEPENQTIELQLLHNDTHLVYQITDFVGIPFKGILSMMIPFLSSKTPSEIVTGEMGSGFFNLYRESDRVIIKTVLNNHSTLIVDEPIRDRHNRVVDINRNVQVNDVMLPNRTDILVFIPKAVDSVFQVTSFVYFITNVFGLLNLSNVVFNGNSITIPTVPFLETDDFSSRMVLSSKVESYLFTKEVPFSTLNQYLATTDLVPSYLLYHLAFNLVVNIKHGVYTPVQTRAKINLPPENARKLRKFLLSNAYLLIVEYIKNHPSLEECNNYLRYCSSSSNLLQLLPLQAPDRNLSQLIHVDDFMLHYKLPENNNESFMTLMIKSRFILGSDSFVTASVDKKNQVMRLSQNTSVGEVLVKWLMTKAKPKPPTSELDVPVQKMKQTNRPLFKALEELTTILNVFTEQFWAIAKEVNVYNLLPQVPTVELVSLENQSVKGYYNQQEHKVVLNFSTFVEADVVAFNDFFVRGTEVTLEGPISKNKIYLELIQNEVITRVLIHELEHARRQDSCVNGGHGKVEKIFKSDKNKLYEFDQGANAMYTAILANQLFARVFAELRQ